MMLAAVLLPARPHPQHLPQTVHCLPGELRGRASTRASVLTPVLRRSRLRVVFCLAIQERSGGGRESDKSGCGRRVRAEACRSAHGERAGKRQSRLPRSRRLLHFPPTHIQACIAHPHSHALAHAPSRLEACGVPCAAHTYACRCTCIRMPADMHNSTHDSTHDSTA